MTVENGEIVKSNLTPGEYYPTHEEVLKVLIRYVAQISVGLLISKNGIDTQNQSLKVFGDIIAIAGVLSPILEIQNKKTGAREE